MRDWKGALEWYRTHQTASQIGFNPDGMCLKVCRTARDIGPMFISAVEAQKATPKKYRVHKIRDLRRGMVGFFDDPNDSNRWGHIATMIGRVRGADPDKLSDTLWETNGVKSGELVIVRGDYFERHWGDKFKFGARWLNGKVLDLPGDKKKEPPKPAEPTRVTNFLESRPDWDVNILDRAIKNGRRDLVAKVAALDAAIESLPDDEGDSRVKEVKTTYKESRILHLHLLNRAVKDGRVGAVKTARDKIRQTINSLPSH